MDDLVKRLRLYAREYGPLPSLSLHPETPGYTHGMLIRDTRAAAAEIERLREWKETVRDIYDKALTADPAQCDVVGWVIGTIEARHPEFFCGKPASD